MRLNCPGIEQSLFVCEANDRLNARFDNCSAGYGSNPADTGSNINGIYSFVSILSFPHDVALPVLISATDMSMCRLYENGKRILKELLK